jgi:hypothetical protein
MELELVGLMVMALAGKQTRPESKELRTLSKSASFTSSSSVNRKKWNRKPRQGLTKVTWSLSNSVAAKL